ncbi:MAG TPA: radical SAM protein [Lacunisphaera sp.]|jgi:radical SAM superfamily enzyme YgiQ (UPF0313 family)|nr:radical SAM protein [Lacunisphaera sp.]
MRVALLYPEVLDIARFREKRKEFPPFGVLYLAAMVERAHHEARILKVREDALAFDLRDFDVVAFSIPSSATYGLMLRARAQSIYAGDALLLVGGVHPSFFPEKTLSEWNVHAVGIDEGEMTLLELIEHAKDKELSGINGIGFFKNGKFVRTLKRPLIQSIDSLPLPARHLLDPEDFVMSDRLADTDEKMAHVMFSRGCPFPCRFCAAAQTKIQYRGGASAREELIHLKERYGVTGFAIVDDNFVVNRKKVAEISDSIVDLNLKWSALSRVDIVTEELLRKMYASGCIEIKFGVESGSQRILDAMQKNIRVDDIRNALKLANQTDIRSKVFIIHGYPGENQESTNETLALLEELKPLISRVSLFRFVPLPGTYVYQHPQEFSLRGTDTDAAWDGNWSKYHIHHNDRHWWGSEKDFEEQAAGYKVLNDYIDANWPDRHEVTA